MLPFKIERKDKTAEEKKKEQRILQSKASQQSLANRVVLGSMSQGQTDMPINKPAGN